MKKQFDKIQLPSNYKFGLFFTTVFFISSSYFYIRDFNYAFYAFMALGIIFLLITFIKAEILRPLNRMWMILGMSLGMIVSPIILGVIFFLIFSPIGILMRLFGRDELHLQQKNKSSFWINREQNNQPNSYKFQF